MLNVATKKYPYPLPFTNEVINIVIGHKVYIFKMVLLLYYQIFIALENQYKTTFVIDQGTFVWVVMSSEVKNGPPTDQRVITNAQSEYINMFS